MPREEYEIERQIMQDLKKKYGKKLDKRLQERYCDLNGCKDIDEKGTCKDCKRRR